jgi:hypothetical protein
VDGLRRGLAAALEQLRVRDAGLHDLAHRPHSATAQKSDRAEAELRVTSRFNLSVYDALLENLELDIDDIPICRACLSFVVSALEGGDPDTIERTTSEFAPILWREGLAQPVELALERARRRGITGADDAIGTVERNGPRAPIVRAIVQRLAADLAERARGDLRKLGFEPWPPEGLG